MRNFHENYLKIKKKIPNGKKAKKLKYMYYI